MPPQFDLSTSLPSVYPTVQKNGTDDSGDDLTRQMATFKATTLLGMNGIKRPKKDAMSFQPPQRVDVQQPSAAWLGRE